MAQDTVVSNVRFSERAIQAENLSVTVAQAGLTTLMELENIQDMIRMLFQVVAGAQAFDAFEIQAKANRNAAYVTLYSLAGDYTSPSGLLVGASGDLTALAATATGWFLMETRGLYAVRVQASCANVAGSVSNAYGGTA